VANNALGRHLPDGTGVGVYTFNFTGGSFSAVEARPRRHRVGYGCRHHQSLLAPGRDRFDAGWQPRLRWHPVSLGEYRLWGRILAGREVYVVDTIAKSIARSSIWEPMGPTDATNTAAGIGVTPDRSAVYAAIPRLGVVAAANVNTT
jgi:hypothetical protein